MVDASDVLMSTARRRISPRTPHPKEPAAMTTTAVPPTSTQLCGVFADVNAAVAAAREAFLAFSDLSLIHI